ncbi:RICIN domain-containing protein [Nonomuraea sp. NPDC050783]|uniref:RICIN domain-containing protein n=1 Tax=Nonomuraea sp. NPDC050783 TaxID=3154634 RepID=UPI003466E8D0
MRRMITLLAGTTLAGSLLAAPAQAAPSQAAPSQAATGSVAAGSVVELRNVATGMCLAIGRGEARKGKSAIQWPCIHSPAQRWVMSSEGYLVNMATGMCLAIGRGEARKGRPAIQWPCNGGWAQRWKPKRMFRVRGVPEDEFRAYHFMNGATQMCLAIGRGEARKGKSAIQWPCNKAASAQAWRITKIG